jgi:hypothetical protein
MATAKKTTKVTPPEPIIEPKMIDDNHIISLYMDQILLEEHEPKTVYAFSLLSESFDDFRNKHCNCL